MVGSVVGLVAGPTKISTRKSCVLVVAEPAFVSFMALRILPTTSLMVGRLIPYKTTLRNATCTILCMLRMS